MQEEPFPWPWVGPESRRVTAAGLAWIAVLIGWGLFATRLVPGASPSPWPAEAAAEAPLYARFDSGWYADIARDGYGPAPPPGQPSEHAFFPLYPYLGRAIHLATGLPVFPSLLVVSWASFLLALPLFLDEARRRGLPADGWSAVAVLLLYPSAFFLQSAYGDALYLLLALLAFRAVRRGGLVAGVALGFVAGLCRAPAAALGPGLAAAFWLEETPRDRRGSARALGAAALLGVAPFLGVLTHVLGIGWARGEPGLFFRVMAAWPERVTGAASGPAAFFGGLAARVASGEALAHPGLFVPYLLALLLLALAVLQLRGGCPSDAAWMAALLAMPLLTGTEAGIPRYTMTVFPVALALARVLAPRPLLRAAWLAGSASLLLFYAAKFTRWSFVS